MDSIATKIAQRYLISSNPETSLDVNRSGDHVTVTLNLVNREEWYRANGYSRGLPSHMKDSKYVDGKLLLEKASSRVPEKCLQNAQELAVEVFRKPNVPLWVVRDVILGPKLEGRGFGKALYQKAFQTVAPAIIIPDKCYGGRTSPSAHQIWKSLSSKYPSKGSSLDEIAIAVR